MISSDDLLQISFVMCFFGVGAYIYYSMHSAKRKAVAGGVAIESMLDQLRDKLVVVNGSSIPGAEITRVIGMVRGISGQASTKEQFVMAEKEALLNMLSEAKRLGATAVIDARLNTGTYQQQGSQWQVSQAVYNGTAVTISRNKVA